MRDEGLLLLRTAVGSAVAAHGAQKMFGAFDGPGIDGAAKGFEERFALEPGRPMAMIASAVELAGGAATVLGIGGPLAPLALAANMAVAGAVGHAGKPFFAQAGGPELPYVYSAANGALALTGFGRLSVDRLLGLRVSKGIALAVAGASAVSAATIIIRARRAQAHDAAPEGAGAAGATAAETTGADTTAAPLASASGL